MDVRWDDGVLGSCMAPTMVTFPRQVWKPVCQTGSHSAPGWDCECGVNASNQLITLIEIAHEYLDAHVPRRVAVCYAIVKLGMWGRVIVDDVGTYRAQYAYPQHIFLCVREPRDLIWAATARRVQWRYNVTTSVEDLYDKHIFDDIQAAIDAGGGV